MSHCETQAWGKCNCCGNAVAVKKNRSGLAYYRCDHCGVQLQHHWQKSSSALLQSLGAIEPEKKAEHVQVEAPPTAKKKPSSSVASLLGL